MIPNNSIPQYVPRSILYSDDSMQVCNPNDNTLRWAFKEFEDGKYTGNFQLEDGKLIKLAPAIK